jgi:UDP-N-acetylglucosamine 2-epimerase (non-hydrolysing)
VKVLTVLGTRPEIIRLSLVIRLLDEAAEHVLVHTGQNYDDRLDGLFFRELGIRRPDVYLGVRGEGFGAQVGEIIARSEAILREHRPDRLLVLGDTNSGLAALVARRLGIPVFHMEAGNRCYDDRVPEEVNRRVIDHSSTVLMPYTQRSRENLLREGIPAERVYVTGNPIKEVLDTYALQISASTALQDLGLEARQFFLATMHRAENVDDPIRLRGLLAALVAVHRQHNMPVVCSLHPRTRARLAEFGLNPQEQGVRFLEPLGLFDFVQLEKAAFCILSDSGTVQEEACIFRTPAVTIRDVTERPETIECGSNVLAGADPETIARLVRLVTQTPPAWDPPPEYLAPRVAQTVCRIVLGFRLPDRAEQAWQARQQGTRR